MTDLFAHCRGVVPLRPRVADWMSAFLDAHEPADLLARYGSPLNVQSTAPFVAHLQALVDCGQARGLTLTPFFARKANKCLSYVAAARDAGCGIDAASRAEVDQALALGVPGSRIICTAGVKPDALIALCVAHDVTIIVDNDDELAVIDATARSRGVDCRIGLRVAGFEHASGALHSRFGYPLQALTGMIEHIRRTMPRLELAGLQFHLGGYQATHRAAALAALLPHAARLAEQRSARGACPPFVDIGGGFPMRYLAEPDQWPAYLAAHAHALDQDRAPITYNNDALGRRQDAAGQWGAPDAYPTAHERVQADWLADVLDTEHEGRALYRHLAAIGVSLRCEPGRSVLDDCGLTLAHVVHVKQDTAGRTLAGLEMNRTQFRTGFAEVMFDPFLCPGPNRQAAPAAQAPVEAYLTGTYCTESEFIYKRRFVFDSGLQRGDVVGFPNSAGYLIHFLESRSHQFALATNVFIDADGGLTRDAIDA